MFKFIYIRRQISNPDEWFVEGNVVETHNKLYIKTRVES